MFRSSRQCWSPIFFTVVRRIRDAGVWYSRWPQSWELREAGVEKVFSERVLSVAKREQLEAALDFSRKGDMLV